MHSTFDDQNVLPNPPTYLVFHRWSLVLMPVSQAEVMAFIPGAQILLQLGAFIKMSNIPDRFIYALVS